MGMNELWAHLSCEWEGVDGSQLRGKTLAIDGQVWLYECTREACSTQRSLLFGFFSRCKKIMEEGIIPYLLFDRYQNSPVNTFMSEDSADKTYERDGRPIKVDENARSRFGRGSIDDNSVSRVIQLLQCMGIPYFYSHGVDNEAAASYLEETGKADGFISPQMEYFLYGGANLYRVEFEKNGSFLSASYQRITAEKLFLSHGLNRARMVALAALLGCDYIGKGIAGIGLVISLELLSEFSISEDDHPITILDRFRSYCSEELSIRKGDSPTRLKLRRNHFSFPQGFPNSDVFSMSINAFMWPNLESLPFFTPPRLPYNNSKIQALLLEEESRGVSDISERARRAVTFGAGKRSTERAAPFSRRQRVAIDILRHATLATAFLSVPPPSPPLLTPSSSSSSSLPPPPKKMRR